MSTSPDRSTNPPSADAPVPPPDRVEGESSKQVTAESAAAPAESIPTEGAEAEPAPAGAPAPARTARATTTLGAGPRDMLISMLILLPIVGLMAFLGRGCSFSPGAPTMDPSAIPTVDTRQALGAAARQVPFPLRQPVPPGGWRANVVDQRKAPGDASAVRVGWITPAGRYLRLVQTTAEEGALVAAETGGPPGSAAPVQAAGLTWVNYTGANNEQAWAYRADGVEWLITGDGIVPEFQI
ncbi:MAG TPA: DUF4245 domain-containing protein, partial [Pseudonocardia sp.]|uniref:DUF4245 domain-containing protein n=1 Tax=Pseudonocardia sp. TaxID=60912 RepID=UPI002EDB8786